MLELSFHLVLILSGMGYSESGKYGDTHNSGMTLITSVVQKSNIIKFGKIQVWPK